LIEKGATPWTILQVNAPWSLAAAVALGGGAGRLNLPDYGGQAVTARIERISYRFGALLWYDGWHTITILRIVKTC